MGIASLGTRMLPDVDTDSPQSLVNAVRSQMFSIHPKRASAKAWVPASLWAIPEEIEHDEICDKLDEVFFNKYAESNTRPNSADDPDVSSAQHEARNVIFVGHSIRSDRSLLMELFDFDIKTVPSIGAIIDTGRMMCSAYDLGIATHSHFPLRMILRYLGIDYDQLHDAGNDAMFTMKAMLLMFSNWKSQKGRHLWNVIETLRFSTPHAPQLVPINSARRLLWECQLEVLAAIARETWPAQKKPASPHKRTMPHRIARTGRDLLSHEDFDLAHMFG